MSKPNLLGFSSSVGIYRNKKMRDLRALLLKKIRREVPVADMAPMLFQIVMAYAGENQIDGNFAGYTPEHYREIFATNHVPLSATEAEAISKAFHEVGLLEKGHIRSWAKFNRHFAEHEKIVKAKRRAGKLSQKRREQEAREAVNGHDPKPEKTAPKSAPKPVSPTARAFSLRKILDNHPGRPEAGNAPSDPDDRKLQRTEYRALKIELDRLDKEIAGITKNPVPE